jgi:opacity protein-like surface antigen
VRHHAVPARPGRSGPGGRMRAVLLAAVFTLGAAGAAAAQGARPFTLEARGGLAFPLESFDPGAQTGFLVGATAKYSPIPFLSLYGGWDFARFGAEDDAGFTGVATRVTDSGLRVGAELGVPLVGLMSGIAPYVQGGATFSRIRVEADEDPSGTLDFESSVTRGFEVGAGARISVAPSFSLTPEVRYRRTRPEFDETPSIDIAAEVAYLAASLGFNLHF